MGKETYKILHPKASGLVKKEKPVALVINSPFDEIDAAVNLKGKRKVLESEGFGIMNKGIVYFDTDSSDFKQLIKFSHQFGTNFTLFTNSHGAPGWYFGEKKNAGSELEGLRRFAQLINEIEQYTQKEVVNIVLGGCYSGVELYNPETGQYMNSPARLLSMLFPNKNVVGFLGRFADSNVTHVYQLKKDEDYQLLAPKPENASVLFRKGSLIERSKLELYCTHEDTPDFIKDELRLGLVTEHDYFKSYFFKEDSSQEKGPVLIEEDIKKNLGLKQLAEVALIQEELNSENHPKAGALCN